MTPNDRDALPVADRFRCMWKPLLVFALWTALFFGLQRPDLAFAGIVLLRAAILMTRVAFRVRRVAGMLLVPYAVWVGFAAALNLFIWRHNAAGRERPWPTPDAISHAAGSVRRTIRATPRRTKPGPAASGHPVSPSPFRCRGASV